MKRGSDFLSKQAENDFNCMQDLSQAPTILEQLEILRLVNVAGVTPAMRNIQLGVSSSLYQRSVMELSLVASTITLVIGVISRYHVVLECSGLVVEGIRMNAGYHVILKCSDLAIEGRVDIVLVIRMNLGYLVIMAGTEVTFAAPRLDFEVCGGVLGLGELGPLSLVLDIALMFIAVHLAIVHVLFCEGLLEKHRVIVAKF